MTIVIRAFFMVVSSSAVIAHFLRRPLLPQIAALANRNERRSGALMPKGPWENRLEAQRFAE
ncbi:hypothetical protein [Rhodovulum steppense]|uniref:hypothetical protein n=1 Tax=Rhodovulum steppense TaxID=540251 RepID=UPI00104C89C8|nr:hypothetical protein [Rhodovulum steppense]